VVSALQIKENKLRVRGRALKANIGEMLVYAGVDSKDCRVAKSLALPGDRDNKAAFWD
jgi:hypothetical protein